MANNYFSDLFTSSQVAMSRSQEISNHPTLSFEDQCALNVTLNNSEIWNTFKCINPYKAPGPDGIQAIFYHRYWNIVGEEVCNFIKSCFTKCSIPKDLNKTFVALIPKVDKPESLKYFRPISLCNVIYKAITKILVSRLRPFLTKIISPNQSSFIPGRSTMDIFNFSLEWINLIMSCVSTLTTSILWNGEALPEIPPSRGLRQGDPLSPYLFVLCMERLSILINRKAEAGAWKESKSLETPLP